MNYQHRDLAAGKWKELSLVEQLANIGMEIDRSIKWKNKGNYKYSQQAFYRALELLDLTLADPKNRHRLSEPCRIREVLVDYFSGDNHYQSTDEQWQQYFYPYNYAARLKK